MNEKGIELPSRKRKTDLENLNNGMVNTTKSVVITNSPYGIGKNSV